MTNSLGLVAEEVALASWARTIKRSALQELLAVAARPGVLSFALGLPAAEIFPVASYERAMLRALRETNKALQYGPPLGALKRQIVELMKRRGVSCREEQVFLTTGAQQGVNLLAHLLLNPGGQVLTEEFIYPGFQQVLNIFEPEVLSVPTDLETGIDVDAVEARLAQAAPRRPAFIYAITEGHNPLGVSMSPEKRQRLVELARRYRVPIVEDDPYGLLCYEGETLVPPMRALDEQWVFYVGSFSKILTPALRVGWLVVPESLISKLSIIKESSDIDTQTFAQRTVSTFIEDGHLPEHIDRLCREYALRRDTMNRALEEHFPAAASWKIPTSGLFFWVELPEGADAEALLRRSLEEEQIAFIPGSAFSIRRGAEGANCLRLNFSNCQPAQIEDGVERLARVLNRATHEREAVEYCAPQIGSVQYV